MPKTIDEVFDAWALSGRAETMTAGHAFPASTAFERLSVRPGHRFLDIGCGLGYAVRWAASLDASVKATGVDLSANMIAASQAAAVGLPNATFLQGEFPTCIQGQTFDRVFSVEALYYYADLQQAIEAVFVHLAPGGRFVTVIDHYEENPACHSWSEMVEVPLVLWSMSEWEVSLKKAGFSTVTVTQLPHPKTPETAEWQEVHGSLIISGEKAG